MRERDAIQVILRKAIQQADAKGAGRITGLRLVVGELMDSINETIQSHFNELSRDTIAEGAKLEIRLVPAEVQCMTCFTKYHPSEGEIVCPDCSGMGAKIISGEEFYMEALDLN